MYPQGVCRIRKPACAGNGCAIFPTFNTAQLGKKIRCSAEGDLFRGSLIAVQDSGTHGCGTPDTAHQIRSSDTVPPAKSAGGA